MVVTARPVKQKREKLRQLCDPHTFDGNFHKKPKKKFST